MKEDKAACPKEGKRRNVKKHINDRLRTWCESGKALFFALIAEMDLVIKNLINIFFVTHFVGAEGAAAYEIIMPCVMVASALVALGYNGVQAVCAKDYGAGDHEAFERHKNAGYTWILLAMAVLTLLFAAFRTPMLDLLGANEGIEALPASDSTGTSGRYSTTRTPRYARPLSRLGLSAHFPERRSSLRRLAGSGRTCAARAKASCLPSLRFPG